VLVAGDRDDNLMTHTLRAGNDIYHTADVSVAIHLSPVLPTFFVPSTQRLISQTTDHVFIDPF